MQWDTATMNQLKADWNAKVSTADIGRRLGCSKNAVVGKAHRLDLEARPSPIKYLVGGPARPSVPRVLKEAHSLPPLISDENRSKLPARIVMPLVIPPQVPAQVPYRSPKPCCWPIGTPGTKSFKYCDDTAVRGKSYCLEHCKLGFAKYQPATVDV